MATDPIELPGPPQWILQFFRPGAGLDRLSGLLAGVAALGVSLLAGLFTLHRFHDFDVFWHVKTGEWIWEHGRIPHTDPFGGKTTGLPWLDVSWGAQTVAAGVVRLGGLLGLQLLIVAGVILILALLLRRGPLTPAILVGSLAFVLVAAMRFLIRPDILSFPLTIVALALIDRLPGRPRPISLLLACLTAVWTNLHGSFILVLFLLLAGAAGSLLTSDRARALKAYAVAFLLSAGAVLLNPYGYRIYSLFSPYLRSILSTAGILPPTENLGVSEWTPTWRILLADPVFPSLPFLVLVGLLLLSFLRMGRAASPSRILCAGALLVLGLAAVRNVLPFGAAALWTIARNERDRLARAGPRPGSPTAAGAGRQWARIGASALVAALAGIFFSSVLSDRYFVARNLPIVTGVGPTLELVPEGAAEWLARHQPAGRVFNNYNSGAYLLYRLFPRVPNYIDSRFDVTPVDREIRRALGDPAAFDALIERDGIGAIVLLHPSPESILLLPRLAGDSRWTLAFRDANSTIHVRGDTPTPLRTPPIPLAPAIEPAAARINGWLARFKRAVLPVDDLTDAFISGVLGERDRQREAYRRALARDPENPQALEYFAANP